MKYFLDTEFIEGTQKKFFGETKPTIDLISIGIVSEDGREYYAISKDFNVKEAWNRWQERTNEGDKNNIESKLYWIRDNILRPIYHELCLKNNLNLIINDYSFNFSYKKLKRLIDKYGKTNEQIAEEVIKFTKDIPIDITNQIKDTTPQFYGYYSDYDWVAFCWLFGKMINLPKEFPMYCIDLKQIMDEKIKKALFSVRYKFDFVDSTSFKYSFEEKVQKIKEHPEYPKQINEHNSLADAKWNYELYKFLETL